MRPTAVNGVSGHVSTNTGRDSPSKSEQLAPGDSTGKTSSVPIARERTPARGEREVGEGDDRQRGEDSNCNPCSAYGSHGVGQVGRPVTRRHHSRPRPTRRSSSPARGRAPGQRGITLNHLPRGRATEAPLRASPSSVDEPRRGEARTEKGVGEERQQEGRKARPTVAGTLPIRDSERRDHK